MIKTVFGTKLGSYQAFTRDGRRIPLTRIKAENCVVTQIRTKEKNGYNAIQVGWGEKKTKKPGAKGKKAPVFLAEVKVEKIENYKIGQEITPKEILKDGDLVKVVGLSKGKGFAGVVKRWHFKGGPRTHGQSDRERSPGSIGQTTTPGRVFKGKKMAGRMGGVRVTISGLLVMRIGEGFILVKGLVPGMKGGLVTIIKTGEDKRFVPLLAKGQKEIKETEEEKAERLRKEKEAEEKLKEVEKKEPDAKSESN